MKMQCKLLFACLLGMSLCVQSKHQVEHTSDIFLDIQYRDARAISRWLKSKPDLSIVDLDGQTVLIKAVQTGNVRFVYKLLHKGIDINWVDDFGKTALDYAVELGYNRIVHTLVKKQAMVTTQQNLIEVRKVITHRARFLKAIGWMLLIPTVLVLSLAFITPTVSFAIGAYGLFYAPCAMTTVAILVPSMLILSIPAHIAATSWYDRQSWYQPSLIKLSLN